MFTTQNLIDMATQVGAGALIGALIAEAVWMYAETTVGLYELPTISTAEMLLKAKVAEPFVNEIRQLFVSRHINSNRNE
jgi:hypothetical protein